MKLLMMIFSALCAAAAAALGIWVVWAPAPAEAAEPAAWQQQEDGRSATILFTHDLHAHFIPRPTADGGESGGYARLKTAIDREKETYPDALVLDGGDFSVGSLVQTLYTAQAAELRTMGAMGYDAAAIGNHEFDHKGTGFARMLESAKDAQASSMALLSSSQAPPAGLAAHQERYGPVTPFLPALLDANYYPAEENPDAESIQAAMDRYGVVPTMILERGGVKFGLFGLVGADAHDCAPTSGFALENVTEAAKRCVESLRDQGAEFIICLSHSGTGETIPVSEDEELARAVEGIDLIVSGHTHSKLQTPIVVKDTYIVSAGPYCSNLGSITLQWGAGGKKTLSDYRLIPIDETLPEDAEIAAMVETWKEMVGETYLARYDLAYDQVLTRTAFSLPTPTSGLQENNALGTLVADAFLWAHQNLTDSSDRQTFTFAVTADGVLRASLDPGPITTSMAFDVLSMGVGEDDTSGFPLVAVYITGRELKAAMEVDASVAPIMPTAQLYMSGAGYAFNTRRMFFNRVYQGRLVQPPFPVNFPWPGETIDDDALYRVVTGMYLAQMLGTVQGKSMGLLNLTPKYADGTPVKDFNDCILYDRQGSELKEWYALAAYLQEFDTLPERYADADACGTKHVSASFSPRELFGGWSWISWAAVTVIPLLLAAAVMLLRLTVGKIKKRLRRYGKTQV